MRLGRGGIEGEREREGRRVCLLPGHSKSTPRVVIGAVRARPFMDSWAATAKTSKVKTIDFASGGRVRRRQRPRAESVALFVWEAAVVDARGVCYPSSAAGSIRRRRRSAARRADASIAPTARAACAPIADVTPTARRSQLLAPSPSVVLPLSPQTLSPKYRSLVVPIHTATSSPPRFRP